MPLSTDHGSAGRDRFDARPEPDVLEEAENRAAVDGYRSISIALEILLDDYATGRIRFEPHMRHTGRPRTRS